MASKKKKAAKKKGGKGGKKGGKNNAEIAELRTMIESLQKEVESMNKTIKKQSKRISAIESDNKRLKRNILSSGNLSGYESGASTQSNTSRLVAPRKSATNETDIEASDNESKDNRERSRSPNPTKIRKERSPKPIARRNKPKPKKKASDITFIFDMNHNKIKSCDNGQTALKPKVYAGTIRFGRFLHFTKNNSDKIASYKITFDTRNIGQNGSLALGFATTSFAGWVGSNFGQNNCCIVKGNGQVLLTDKVFGLMEGKEYKHKQNAESLITDKKEGFFSEGQFVTVECDLKNGIGRMWNDTTNKDASDNGKVFEIVLPSDYEVCVVAYMGGSAKKKIFIKDQKFVFDEEE